MTKREKTLGFNFLVVVIIVAHLWGFSKWQKQKINQQQKIGSLENKIDSFRLMDESVLAFGDEISWVNDHTAPVISFEDAQSELLDFLLSSSKRLGFTFEEQLIKRADETDGSLVDDTYFQRVKIQVSTRATEKQIYQWLTEIHQPQEMRIVSYLRLKPSENDSKEIRCNITAEQFISNQ